MAVNDFRVRYSPEAVRALRDAFLYIREESGPARAGTWLKAVYASIDILGAAPRASRDDGEFLGRELRSKLVMSHRVFFTIDDGTQTVYVVDIVHTARQTRLDEYEDV